MTSGPAFTNWDQCASRGGIYGVRMKCVYVLGTTHPVTPTERFWDRSKQCFEVCVYGYPQKIVKY